MEEAARILEGPGYFECERLHARISKDLCIKRQVKNKTSNIFGNLHPDCIKCEQGRGNIKNMSDTKRKHTKRQKPDVPEPEGQNTLLCKCGEVAVAPHNGPTYCSECWGKILSEGKRRKRTGDRGRTNRRGTTCDGVKEMIVYPDTHFNIDLTAYPEIQGTLQKEAEREFRSPEQQILYVLHQWKRIFVDKKYEEQSV